MAQYPYATPADLSITDYYPYFEPVTGGSAGFTMGKKYEPIKSSDIKSSPGSLSVKWNDPDSLAFRGSVGPMCGSQEAAEIVQSLTMGMAGSDGAIGGGPPPHYTPPQPAPHPEYEDAEAPQQQPYDHELELPRLPTSPSDEDGEMDDGKRPRTGSFPAKITGGEGRTFTADIYVRGLNEAPISKTITDVNEKEADPQKLIGKTVTVSTTYSKDTPKSGTFSRYFDSSEGAGGGMWGKITGGVGSNHQATLYPEGPQGPAGESVELFIPMIGGNEEIPPDTWVSGITEHSLGGGAPYYAYQPPTWLGKNE